MLVLYTFTIHPRGSVRRNDGTLRLLFWPFLNKCALQEEQTFLSGPRIVLQSLSMRSF